MVSILPLCLLVVSPFKQQATEGDHRWLPGLRNSKEVCIIARTGSVNLKHIFESNDILLLNICLQLHLLVLRVAKFAEWVSGSTAIANEDVEVAVVAKQQLSTIVIGRRLYHLQDGSATTTTTILIKKMTTRLH